MILALEMKKTKRTGLIPAFLAGALAASAFPVLNIAFRTELFTSQDLPPVDILLQGNWDMLATFHSFLAILGACILYHTEFANRAIEKLYMLPVSQGKVFFCKNLLLLLLFLPVFLIEDGFLLFVPGTGFPGKDPGLEILLQNTAFSIAAILPVLLLSTLIASLAKNMWVSLGIGVVCMFMGQMTVSYEAVFSKVYTFCLPYRCLLSSSAWEDIFPILGVCAAESVLLGAVKIFSLKDQEDTCMNLLTIFHIELKKIRRTHIIWILLIPLILLWIPAILNADSNFSNAAGLSPEMNFFFQTFLGLSWFMYPASLVVITVMLNQLERSNQGMQKMLSLPVYAAGLCLGKFLVLLLLAAFQMFMMAALYFPAAFIVSHSTGYDFVLPLSSVLYEALIIYISSIPMAAFYWLAAVCIQTSVFSVGIGLAAIVPSVLLINTKAWFAYPMCYPFHILSQFIGQPKADVFNLSVDLFPLLPVAIAVTLICLIVSCLCFGRAERR